MWWFLILHFFKPKLLLPKVGSNLKNYFGKISMTNSKFQTPLTLNSHKSGLKNHRIKNYHIFGISRTSAFIWHIWIPLKNFCKRTRRVCVCIVLVHFGRYSQEVNEKSVKLAV